MTSARELRDQLDKMEARMSKVQIPVCEDSRADSNRAEFRTYLAYKKLQELKRRQVELILNAKKAHQREYFKKRGTIVLLFLLFMGGMLFTLDSFERGLGNHRDQSGSLTGAVIGYTPPPSVQGGVGVLSAPTQGTPILNSTFGTNLTTENLTLWNISSFDADGDTIKNIVTWQVNSSPFTLVNLPFEGGSNSSWSREYAFGNNATVVGAIFNTSSGFDGRGTYIFDGVDDMIVLPNIAQYDTPDRFTAEAWINASDLIGYQDLIARHDGGGGGADAYLIRLNGSEVEVLLGAQDGYFQENTTAAGITAGQYIHLVVAYDGIAGAVNIYVNGVNQSTVYANSVPSLLISSPENLTLGGFQGPSPDYFNGTLDEVRLYNATLGPSQVEVLFQNKSMLIVNETIRKGQVWQGAITPNDGTTDGTTDTSNTLTVVELNVAPLVGTPQLTPETAFENDTIVANVTYSDANGDIGTVYFWWFRNGVNIVNDTKTGIVSGADVLSSIGVGNYSHFDNISVVVGSTDGLLYATNQTSLVKEIQNIVPSVPLLLELNGTTTINLSPILTFNHSTDADIDTITYELLVDDNPTFNNPEVNKTGIVDSNASNNSVQVDTELAVDTTYYWKIRATDGFNYSTFSEVYNFTVSSYLVLNVLQNNVNFGSMTPGESANTSGTNITPFRIENGGNVIANVTITGTNYFTSINASSPNYQVKIEASEPGAFNESASAMMWMDMPFSSVVSHIVNWDFHSWKNDAFVHLLVTVPQNESLGSKNSTVTFSMG